MKQIKTIKNQIAAGKTKKAFDLLFKHMDENDFDKRKATQLFYNKITLLLSRFNLINEEAMLGVLTQEVERTNKTRINYDLMNFLDEMPDMNSKSNSLEKAYNPISSSTKDTLDDEERLWANAKKKNKIFFYETYRQLYPKGKYITTANEKIAIFKDKKKKITDQNERERTKIIESRKATEYERLEKEQSEKIATKTGLLAIVLAVVCGGGAFVMTGEVTAGIGALIGVYVLMVIVVAVFERS